MRPTRFSLAFVALLSFVFGSGWVAPAGGQATPEELLGSFRWRNIGPANMGGRIVDIEAVEKDFATVFLASASGGVWKSRNAGTSWEPVFDEYPSASVGDIAIFQPNPDIVWVGTGEANNRNSVAWGDGVYKSTDGGRTFEAMGLESTHQIARVVTHPTDPEFVYVAAVGHLWGYSGDRGLFRTTDGGATWVKLAGGLPDDGRTGATDIVMDPTDPNTLYVAFYHRIRRPWTFHSGGPGGGIFKSADGGETWRKLSGGLPEGETGRIGLAIYRGDPAILMAFVEAEQTDDLNRPGSGVYRSEDAGETWTYVNTYNNRPFYYSQIRINPLDDQRVYLLTTRFMVSEDGGRTLRDGSEDEEIHGDFHAMWLDPTNKDRYYIGDDKGAHLTHDHGEHFVFFDNIAVGQYYRIGVDMRDPYYVYGGLQDNGTFGGPSFSRDARGILNDSNWKLHWGDGQDVQVDPADWRTLYTEAENGSFRRYDVLTQRFSGAEPGPDNTTNYAEVVGRRPPREALRFNWSAPLVMSPHDPAILFLGGNYLFRTTDRGETWTIISSDLSNNHPEKTVRGQSGGITPDNTGAETHATITSVSQSPVTPAVIWVGTDDGNVQVTVDGGSTWSNVRGSVVGVPKDIWVDRVEASHFDSGTAYVTFDGHRSDIVRPWLFKTTDFGRSWTEITSNLPRTHPAHVIREDLRNPRLLFAGTEAAVFVSLDGGGRWHRLMNGMPTVATQDLVIHPRDFDLVAGTHGRSLWILDDVTPLQQLTPEVLSGEAYLFEQRRVTLWENVSRGGQRGHFWFAGENPATIEPTSSLPRAEFRNVAMISYLLNHEVAGPVTLRISDVGGILQHTAQLAPSPGIHRYRWDLGFDPEPLTADEKRVVEETFQRLLEERGSSDRLLTMRERFRRATTPVEEREAIRPLVRGMFGMPGDLGEEYGVPQAGPGSYLLELTVSGRVYRSTLQIRPDPLLDTAR